MKCGQANCDDLGTHKFTWPGRDEALVCDEHLPKLQGVCRAMGLYLQVCPVGPLDALLADGKTGGDAA